MINHCMQQFAILCNRKIATNFQHSPFAASSLCRNLLKSTGITSYCQPSLAVHSESSLININESKNINRPYESIADVLKRKNDRLKSNIRSIIGESDRYVNHDDWKNIQNEVLTQNFCKREIGLNGLLMDICVFFDYVDASKSLYDFLKLNGKCTSVHLSLLLRLCGKHFEDFGQQFVFDIYNELKSYSDLMNSEMASDAISALSRTTRWKECLDLIDMIKITDTVSRKTFMNIILAAFITQESEIGWKLMHEMQTFYPGCPCDAALVKWLNICNSESNEEKATILVERMLFFLKQYQVYPNTKVVLEIKNFYERKKEEKWIGNFVEIPVSASGKCPDCQISLEKLIITPEEFSVLRTHVLEKFFLGEEVYRNTSPNEVQQFQSFIKRTAPFDIVIDGLNAMYPRRGSSFGDPPEPERLLNVVSYFAKHKKKRVLVLGRNHMFKLKNMVNSLKKIACYFFTSNTSADDTFILYAAIYSGLHCHFLSKDLMREHAERLNEDVKESFDKWRRSHQLELIQIFDEENIVIQQPDLCATEVNKTITTWHIPYDNGFPRLSYQFPIQWLCLQKKNQ